MPSSTPALPAWQLANGSGDASSNSNEKGSPLSTSDSTPAISLSETPAPVSPVALVVDEGSIINRHTENSDKESHVDSIEFQCEVNENNGLAEIGVTDKLHAQSQQSESDNEEDVKDKVNEVVDAAGDNVIGKEDD